MSTGNSVFYGKSVGVKQARDALGRFMVTAMERPTEIVLEEAVTIEAGINTLVPVDSGDLKSSVRVNVDKRGKLGFSVTASASSVHRGYDYAEIQHENLAYQHDAPQSAKYIEKPFMAGVRRIIDRLDREVTE